MDNPPKLGQLIKEPVERDAVHIAVIPVQAGDDHIIPGEPLKFAWGSRSVVLRCTDYDPENAVGVADPFLFTRPNKEGPITISHPDYREIDERPTSIRKGDWFWMFLLPGSVTGMRHHYYCAAIDTPPRMPVNEHEDWLREFAQRWNFDYDEMISAATSPKPPEEPKSLWDAQDYICARGQDLHSAGELGDDLRLFWEHIEGLTQQKYSAVHKQHVGWTCTC